MGGTIKPFYKFPFEDEIDLAFSIQKQEIVANAIQTASGL